jgi:hypothetical protein
MRKRYPVEHDYVHAHWLLGAAYRLNGDLAQALQHAREARRLATCDGPPDYTYKVAYDEAGALLDWSNGLMSGI